MDVKTVLPCLDEVVVRLCLALTILTCYYQGDEPKILMEDLGWWRRMMLETGREGGHESLAEDSWDFAGIALVRMEAAYDERQREIRKRRNSSRQGLFDSKLANIPLTLTLDMDWRAMAWGRCRHGS